MLFLLEVALWEDQLFSSGLLRGSQLLLPDSAASGGRSEPRDGNFMPKVPALGRLGQGDNENLKPAWLHSELQALPARSPPSPVAAWRPRLGQQLSSLGQQEPEHSPDPCEHGT